MNVTATTATLDADWMSAVAVDANRVTVIVPAHNRAELLEAALASVWAQTYRPLEVIVVDDGSSDGTAARVSAWVADRPEDPGISLQMRRHAQSRGPSAARNAGLRMSRGAFINFLDSDDRFLPEKLALQVDALRQAPDASCCYGVTRCVDAGGQVLELMGRAPASDPVLDAVIPAFGCIAPLWRRAALRAAGPWDESLSGREDWEHRARVLLAGGPGIFLDHVVCEKRMHGGTRESAHGLPEFARRVWACARAVQAHLAADSRTSPEARLAWAAQCSGIFRTLLNAGCDAEAREVLWAMVAMTAGPEGRRYRQWQWAWRLGGPGVLRLAGRFTGRLRPPT